MISRFALAIRAGLFIPSTTLCTVLLATSLSACHDQNREAVHSTPHADYAAVARGKVDVEGGLLDVIAPESGVFSHVAVKAGDIVKQGQLLAELDPATAQLDVDQARAALAQAEAERHLQAIRLPAAEALAKRWQKAAQLGAAQQQQADDAAQTVLQIQADEQVATAAVQVAQQKVAAATYVLNKRAIRAPQAGEVVKVMVQTGSLLTGDQRTAFTLLPQHPLIVRAEVNESFITRIKLGMKAGLFPDSSANAATAKPIAAHVSQIGKVFEVPHLITDPSQQNNRVVACILTLDPAATTVSSPKATTTSVASVTTTTTQPLLIGQNVLVKFYD